MINLVPDSVGQPSGPFSRRSVETCAAWWIEARSQCHLVESWKHLYPSKSKRLSGRDQSNSFLMKIFEILCKYFTKKANKRMALVTVWLLMVWVFSSWDQIHGNTFCSTKRWNVEEATHARACWSENWSRHWLSEPIRNSCNYGGGSNGGLH